MGFRCLSLAKNLSYFLRQLILYFHSNFCNDNVNSLIDTLERSIKSESSDSTKKCHNFESETIQRPFMKSATAIRKFCSL